MRVHNLDLTFEYKKFPDDSYAKFREGGGRGARKIILNYIHY